MQPCFDKIVLADGGDHHVEGQCAIRLTFGLLDVEHSVLVVDVDVMGFLGSDFMKKHACKLDFGQRSITIDNQTFVYREVIQHRLCYQQRSRATKKIPCKLCGIGAKGSNYEVDSKILQQKAREMVKNAKTNQSIVVSMGSSQSL